MSTWTDKNVSFAVECLKGSQDIHAACAAIEKGLKRPVDLEILRKLFGRRRLKAPLEYLSPKAETPLARQERENNESRLRREHKELVEQLRDAQEREKFLVALHDRQPLEIKRREIKSGLREATATALLSDLHVEEQVTPAQSGGLNTYNPAIAAESMHRFFAGIRWMIDMHRQQFVIRDLVLAGMGDWMTGYIHEAMKEVNAYGPVKTSLVLFDYISDGLKFLLEDTSLEKILVPCVPGNHGRTTHKIQRETYCENSYEWLLYQRIAHEFRNEPRLVFDVSATTHKWVKVYDATFHITHGDEVKYAGGVGGLAVPLLRRIPAWDLVRKADLHLLGHFHTFLDLNRAIVNGSMIGYNAYGMSCGFAPEVPSQAFFLWDSKRGKTCVSPIWVRK